VNGLASLGKRTGLLGAAAGVVVAGAAVGLAAERYAVGRSFRGADPDAREPFGKLHSPARPVTTEDGVRLHVEVEEPPAGGGAAADQRAADAAADPVTVVFCHGYTLDQDSWHYQRRDLGDLGRLVFWDQRGHGRSQRGTMERADVDRLGRDLLTVLDAVAAEGPIVLVGHSMGGMTVMALADQHPELFGERVVGVALLSTSPGRLAEVAFGMPALAGRLLRRMAPRALDALGRQPGLVERGWRLGKDVAYVLTKRYSFATDVSPSLVEFCAGMIAATPIEVVAELYPAFAAHDKLSALPVLDGVETLVLCGDSDALTPRRHSEAIVEEIPGAELVIVPNGGHLVMLEHPAVVNDHLRALVARARRSAAPNASASA
jgi:pimeloyl-ACP methyl ester carboxylesterase